jgi:hypothetical protein
LVRPGSVSDSSNKVSRSQLPKLSGEINGDNGCRGIRGLFWLRLDE